MIESFFGRGWEWARAKRPLDDFPFEAGMSGQQLEWISRGYRFYVSGLYVLRKDAV